jgi:flagellar hook assembly protein FlgD
MWDGKDGQGKVVPDGDYEVDIFAVDRAGNSFSASSPKVRVDTRHPTIKLGADKDAFSPNGDGVAESVKFTPDVKDKDGFVDWKFTISAKGKTPVEALSLEGKDAAELDSLYEFKGLDGNGKALPEGIYTASLDVDYINGYRAHVESAEVLLDRTYPTATVKPDKTVFNPAGKADQSKVSFVQSGSDEELWLAKVVTDSGITVKRWSFQGQLPTIVWDGSADSGLPAPDGFYKYFISSTDRAGNAFKSAEFPIEIDSVKKELKLSASALAFSPNGDGIKDRLEIAADATASAKIASWALSIYQADSADRKAIKTWAGTGQLQKSFAWDGMADSGIQAPDGAYSASLEVSYPNGDKAKTELNSIVLDRIAPKAKVAISAGLFSPNGDGVLDQTTIQQEALTSDQWKGSIANAKGEVVRSWAWDGKLADQAWDGLDQVGSLVADGTYYYELTSADAAGNSFSSGKLPIGVETEKKTVRLDIDQLAFSPNGDGIRDELTLASAVQAPDRVKDYELKVVAQEGPAAMTAVRTWKGSGSVAPKLIWRGETDAGLQAPDGKYAARLTIHYLNGDTLDSSTPAFIVDRIVPKVEVKADLDIISPNGDGIADQVRFTQSSVPGDDWKGTIAGTDGKVVRNLAWKNEVADFAWDGRDDTGAIVKDGQYTYRVESTDVAGNRGSSSPITIAVETEQKAVSMTVAALAFSPNGDGIKDNLTFLVKAQYPERVKQFDLTITQDGPAASSLPVRSWKGSTDIGTQYVWNGTTDSGIQAPDGQYRAKLTVIYRNGDLHHIDLGPIVLDRVAPKATVRLSTPIFSPNGDGVMDSVDIVQEAVPGDLWQGQITSSANAVVRSWTWKDRLETVTWDGRNQVGAQVPDGQYSYELRSEDAAGNSFSSGKLPIEVDAAKRMVRLDIDQRAFSPNGDGIRDELALASTVQSPERVKDYELRIVAQEGPAAMTTVRAWKGTGSVMPKLIWRGETDTGLQVPDGKYAASLTIHYLNGDALDNSTPTFLVDRIAPKVDVSADLDIISPNGDGRSDQVRFTQSSVPGDDWKGTITGADGKVVKNLGWKNEVADFVWDGRDDAGAIVKDGKYTYQLNSSDAAGNRGQSAPIVVAVETEKKQVTMEASTFAFSPNGDGVKDNLTFLVKVQYPERVKQFDLTITQDGPGTSKLPVRVWKGSTDIGTQFVWDGTTDSGIQAPDGQYRAKLTVLYRNDDLKQVELGPITLDRQAPQATVRLSTPIFSPNGDGIKDTVDIVQEAVPGDLWQGQITSSANAVVRSWTWKDKLETVTWDGKNQAKIQVPDGQYSYELKSVDAAGNSFSSGKLPIEVDAAKKTVRMDVDQRAFSPNGDGVKDQLYINIIAPKPESITEYEIGVYALDQAGKRQVNPIRMWRGASDIKDQYAWDGKTESGIAAPDGRYQVTFKLLYNNGDAFAQVSPEVVIDTVAPSISVDAAPLVFSPNGDGNKDTISFTQKSNLGDDWTGRIRNASGSVIRTYTWKSEAKSFVWDGKDAAGTLVKDGVYSYEVSATDLAGNTASAKIAGITVDGTKPKVYVSASDTGISPNDDGIRDDVSFTIVVEQREGIESWRFSLIDKQGNEKSYFGGTGSDVPSRLVWDGRDLQGQVVQGEYVGKLVVTYAKGDVATASSAKVLVDANPPVVSIDVKPEYFSPDGDGVGDTLTFSIKADSGSAIVDWKLEVYEKAVVETSAPEETTQGQERLFMDWSGKSNPPATISWNGLSSRKELVESATDYPFKFVARDALGNTTTVAGIIAVDVLVIRDGDRLKIQVPSIVFRANYADFNGLAPEIMDRNKKVITRIAQILNKFPDYRINIQGHANNVGKMMGLSAAKIQTEETKELIPLSTGRAELVRTMLVQSGVDARRLSTEGLGSSEPVVSFTDVVNRWKNRRVEFVLIKNQ